jgi:hypothetical protein
MNAPRGPDFSGVYSNLFAEHSSFSANLETKAGDMTAAGKVFVDQGKSRFEMDLSKTMQGKASAEDLESMKSMGMDRMVMLNRPDKKVNYMIYPGLKGYIESATPQGAANSGASAEDYKVEKEELGKETVDGHPCVKSKVTITDKQGEKHVSTVWTATDLKNFPVKTELTQEGKTVTMLFKDVSFSKPDAALFDPPGDFKKHDNMMGLMQEMMMRQAGGDDDGEKPARGKKRSQ